MIKSTPVLLVLVLPPFLADEEIPEGDARIDSEGYTSRIFMCCK